MNFDKHVMEYIDLSTRHITRNDDVLLSKDNESLIVYRYFGGYFIFIYNDNEHDFACKLKYLKRSGYSDMFCNLLKEIHDYSKDIIFLRLDCDGMVNSELPEFDW